MSTYIDSWKNKKVFEKQLETNLNELNSYPQHWEYFVSFMSKINVQHLLDIGCGCGTYYELCRKHFPDVKYVGVDYANEAVELAKKHWNYSGFYVKNYKELTKEYIKHFDILHACSLHNVLPNGDEALQFFIDLQPRYMILGKLLTTKGASTYKVYKAYNEIETYLYYHNIDNVKKLFKQGNYEVFCNPSQLPTEYLLVRK